MFKAMRALFGGNLIGKLLGIIRELILAALFGTGVPVAAYRTAQTAIFSPVHFFTSDTLNAGFIPLYSRHRQTSVQTANNIFWAVSILLLSVSVLLGVPLLIFPGWWVRILAPGFSGASLRLTIVMVRLMAIGIPFYIFGNLLSYLEMAHDRYTLSSFRSSTQSIGLILFTLLAFVYRKPYLLAFGFTLTYVCFFIWGMYRVLKSRILVWPPSTSVSGLKEGIKAFWITVRPLLLLPFFLQGTISVERMVSTLMGPTGAASLDYARVLIDTAVLLLGVPIGLVSLKTFGSALKGENRVRLLRLLTTVLMLTVPASIFLFVYSDQIVTLLYARGAFDATSARTTSSILKGFSLGLWAQVTGYILLKILNAQGKNAKVTLLMGVALCSNIIIDLSAFKVLGPIALGIGGTSYAVIFMTLAVFSLELTRDMLRAFTPLAIGGVIIAVIGELMGRYISSSLLLAVPLTLSFWFLFCVSVPQFRHLCFKLIGKAVGRDMASFRRNSR